MENPIKTGSMNNMEREELIDCIKNLRIENVELRKLLKRIGLISNSIKRGRKLIYYQKRGGDEYARNNKLYVL